MNDNLNMDMNSSIIEYKKKALTKKIFTKVYNKK